MDKLYAFSAPLGRVFLAAVFIISGFNKVSGFEDTQGYMESVGLPGMLLPLVIAFEVLGGLAIVLGFKARLVALLMVGFNVLSAILFHANFADQTQMMMFLKNFAIAGGFLMIVAHGAGAYALDNRHDAYVDRNDKPTL